MDQKWTTQISVTMLNDGTGSNLRYIGVGLGISHGMAQWVLQNAVGLFTADVSSTTNRTTVTGPGAMTLTLTVPVSHRPCMPCVDHSVRLQC